MSFIKLSSYQIFKIFKTSLFKSFGIYFFSKVISSAIPFLMLPVLTEFLSSSDYGIISMYLTVVAFVNPFVSFNFETALSRRYFYNDGKISEYIGSCFSLSLIFTLFVSILFYLFSNLLCSFTQTTLFYTLIIPFHCYSIFISNSLLSIWQVNEKPIQYGIFSILKTLIEITITLLLITQYHLGWKGQAISVISTSIIFSIVSILLLIKNYQIKFKYYREQLLHALKYGGGLIPHSIGASLIVLTNRFFLTKMISIDETGIYSVAIQLCSVLSFIAISFNNAYTPWLYKKLTSSILKERIKIVRFSYGYILLLFIIGFVVYFIIKLIMPFMVNDNFSPALKYVPWILLAFIFQGCYFMVTNYILYSEKTRILALITISVGIINIPLNYFFISVFGGIGAAISFTTIFFIYFVVTWIVSSKIYPMPWSIKQLLNE